MSETKLAWTMIYASILGISYHPRQTENGGKPSITPEQAAAETDAAMAPWIERWGENGAR
jgi:hypothetical protein